VVDLSGPVQLHHGTADTSVPIAFSESLAQRIQDVGGVVEYFTYPGDNHNLSKNLDTALQRSVAFFDKYVKNPS
jgi:dipeptidyl aminopeptidase/acylaminoacyl peptidase